MTKAKYVTELPWATVMNQHGNYRHQFVFIHQSCVSDIGDIQTCLNCDENYLINGDKQTLMFSKFLCLSCDESYLFRADCQPTIVVS